MDGQYGLYEIYSFPEEALQKHHSSYPDTYPFYYGLYYPYCPYCTHGVYGCFICRNSTVETGRLIFIYSSLIYCHTILLPHFTLHLYLYNILYIYIYYF